MSGRSTAESSFSIAHLLAPDVPDSSQRHLVKAQHHPTMDGCGVDTVSTSSGLGADSEGKGNVNVRR
jgi:hypothetical protein